MSKGKDKHEAPIQYLIEKFGPGETLKLEAIYNEEYRSNTNHTCYPLTVDYVGNSSDCNAYIDVFTAYGCGEWRQLMGKVVACAYEIQQTKSDREIWMVSADLYDKPDCPDYQDYFRRMVQVARDVLVTELRSKIHYKDFNPEAQNFETKFKEIPLDIPKEIREPTQIG